ncbi:HAD-IA family hydrolase [Streptomyces sp. NRRL WC-3549]|uniref:HAD-IA family hydrolase n=1 Tax=Streptomyces sp. NRRL WC-3549 TaxID=1463925 RepID=UPI0007C6CDB3|nr:HAD-IA family hydrolase [Streptomyces sp. NRRL WC-3549]
MNRPVRVVVVGMGWAGREIWLPRLTRHPAFEVMAVVDPVAGPVDSGTPLLGDVAEIESGTVDLAVVAVPNHLHADIAEELLLRGIPVFLEKPVCLTSAEAGRLAEAERAGGAVLLAGSASRYRADVRALYERTSAVGRIRHIDVSWVRARGVPDSGGWFTQAQLSGGGALVDLGWHLLDSIAPILGPAALTQVVGTSSDDFVNTSGARAGWRDGPEAAGAGAGGGDVEDTARGFLVTEDGVSVALRASWASHEAHDVTLIRVEGSAGVVSLRCTFGFSPNREGGSDLTFTSDGETARVPFEAERIGAEYDRQLDELPGLLGEPAMTGRAVADALRNIGVIERLYACARQNVPNDDETGEYRMDRRVTGLTGNTPVVGPLEHPRSVVVFDLDGVLVDSTEVMREAFSIAYAEVVGEGPAPFAEYNRHLGRYFPDIMRIMDLPLEMEEPFVRESYRMAHLVPLFDGVPEMLHTLRERGIRLAVATGKSGPRARSLLSQLGVLDLFDHVIGSDEIARPKPAPDIVLKALELLGADPDSAVMVGDAVTDIASAHAAGVAALAALWGESDEPALLAAAPDAVLQKPGDLLALWPAGALG